MDTEKIIFDIIASDGSSQTGDLSQALKAQGFFDDGVLPNALKGRDKNVTGNPVDVKKDFFKQNTK